MQCALAIGVEVCRPGRLVFREVEKGGGGGRERERERERVKGREVEREKVCMSICC